MEKLIVKNFGAIRSVEIELNHLTVFIGKTGTGKSTLAKLVSIFRSADSWLNGMDATVFSQKLAYYQIDSFLETSTFMEYQSDIGMFIYKEGEIILKLSENLLSNLYKSATTTSFYEEGKKGNEEEIASQSKNASLIEKLVNLTCNEVIYIPAERTVVSFLSEKYPALDREKLIGLFPEPLLDFTGYFNKVSSIVRKLYLSLFDVTYQKENGKDYIILPNGKQFLLSEAASGQQTTIPALIVFEYYAQDDRRKSYTFEEPELNLFPIAQKSLVELLAEKVLSNGHKVVITTHSPYILTVFNTLIQAGNVYKNNSHQKDVITKVVPEKYWLDFDEVSVFYLDDSSIQSVMNHEYQTIDANAIDDVSDMIATEYDQLLELKYESEE